MSQYPSLFAYLIQPLMLCFPSIPHLKKTLNNLGPFFSRLNASALNYFNHVDRVSYSGFVEAVQLAHLDRRHLKLQSNEGVQFWCCWLEAIQRWFHKFQPDLVSDMMYELNG